MIIKTKDVKLEVLKDSNDGKIYLIVDDRWETVVTELTKGQAKKLANWIMKNSEVK